jgi:hypothetical protein
MNKLEKQKQGRKNKNAGRNFELKVRKDLEAKGWIVAKWTNNVDLETNKLIPAKHKFNFFTKVMAMGTGFPDFIGYWVDKNAQMLLGSENARIKGCPAMIIGIEAKSNGYLDKTERAKVNWLLENKIFSLILIAKKGNKRGEIIYEGITGKI